MHSLLSPRHALDTACSVAMKLPRLASEIACRVIADPNTDDATARAAISLALTLRRFNGGVGRW